MAKIKTIQNSIDHVATHLEGEASFTIDLSPALKKADEKPVEITLTPEEEKEFERYDFKSRLPIEITGDIDKRATNILRVGGAKVTLGDAPFALFLRLVVELFKGGDGSVYKGDPEKCGGMVDEEILKPDYIDHTINKLREKLAPALQGLPATDFIQAHRQKHIRLSTHPRYISYEKDRLVNHPDSKIVELAGKLNP